MLGGPGSRGVNQPILEIGMTPCQPERGRATMSTNTFCPTANLRTPNLARQLAKASWFAPLVGICLNYLTAMEGNPPTVQIRIGAAAFGFYLAGVVFGIAA